MNIGIFILLVFGLFAYGPIPQWTSYHDFADKRDFCGIPNFLDVTSNVSFLIAGLWMLKQMIKENKSFYYGMSISLILLFFGSAYYHFQPDNLRLVYDRLPIASFFSILFIFINHQLGIFKNHKFHFFYWLLSISSVIIWYLIDDLRFYALAQFFPLLMISTYFIIGLFQKYLLKNQQIFTNSTLISFAILIFGYGISKIFESFDYEVLFYTQGLISGHTVKHILAGTTIMLYFYHEKVK